MRVLEVLGLGWDGVVVDIEGETVLLLDPALPWAERIDLMSSVMASDL